MAALKQITDLTAIDETPEQAVALELPLASGGTKPFRDMTSDESIAALRLMKQGEGAVERPAAPAPDPAVADLQQKADAAVGQWLPNRKVSVRAQGTELLLDVRGVPRAAARNVFLALADLFPPPFAEESRSRRSQQTRGLRVLSTRSPPATAHNLARLESPAHSQVLSTASSTGSGGTQASPFRLISGVRGTHSSAA